ncbi:MAG TPA: DinB family protein, partial [Blastocatellia bacterium]|nr:DinB family protein [Blastocatellia bacterium]
ESFVKNWNRIHKQTARVIQAAPADRLDWQPAEGMFTLRQLITHIPQAELTIIRSALAGSMQKVPLDLSTASVDDIVSAFDSNHTQLAEEVSKLTPDQLNDEVEMFGRKMPRRVLLRAVTEHEIHHRGQLFTYLRLAGIEPPSIY